MTTTLDPQTLSKIERRARRAFSALDAGEHRKFHRITDLTPTSLTYRLRHRAGQTYRGGPRIPVKRDQSGQVLIELPPPSPTLNLLVTSDLDQLKTHNGKVRAYKVTKKDGTGPHYSGLHYAVGKLVEEPSANTDPSVDCGAGVNLGTLDYAKRERGGNKDYRVFAVEFDAQQDLAVVPRKSNGKFRVFRCTVVEELDPDRI